MKASEGTGAAVGLPVLASVPRPWKTSPLTEGRTLGRKHGVVQPGEPKVLTSVSAVKAQVGGFWVPGMERGFQSTLKKQMEMWLLFLGGLETMGGKGSHHVDHVFTSTLLV